MSITSISTSPSATHRPQAQANAQTTQRAAGQQLKSDGLPDSPLSPSGTSKVGQTLSRSVSNRLLDLHL